MECIRHFFSVILQGQSLQYPTNAKANGDIETLPRPRLAFYGFTDPSSVNLFNHTFVGKSYSVASFMEEHVFVANGLDGLAKRSPMLVPTGKGWQETALQVPETVAEIKLMNPITQAFLTLDVPLQGAVVVME